MVTPLKNQAVIVFFIASFFMVASAAKAISLPVVNPGFEDTSGSVTFFNEFSFGAMMGWEIYDSPGGLIGNGAGNPFYVGTLTPSLDLNNPGDFINFPGGAAEGDRVAIAYNRAGSDGQGEYGLEQTLVGTPLASHRRYTLQVEVGNIASGVAVSGENFNLDGFPGYRVELLADGVAIAQDTTSTGTIDEGEFGTSTLTFTTQATGDELGLNLGIRLINLNQIDPLFPNADLEVDFDNVRLDVVPALDGDYNFDGSVDAADYTVWRDGLTTTFTEDDYLVWRDNYGATQSVEAVAVPEPASAVLLLAGALGVLLSTMSARNRS